MTKKRIGIIVDNPKRDLSGCILIAIRLVSLGHAPILIPMYAQWRDLPRLRLDAVLVNYVRIANTNLVKFCKNKNIKVFVHDTEGGVFGGKGGNSPESMAKHFASLGQAECIDRYYFWGEGLKDAFLKYSKLKNEQVSVTGSARHDLCYSPARFSDTSGKYILVNTNFPIVNPAFSTPQEEIKILIKHGWSEAQASMTAQLLQKLFISFTEEVKMLAEHFSDEKFVVRCHPFEKEAFYTNYFQNIPNIVVRGKGEVLGVMKNAKAILHGACGTSIEANFLGKIPISLTYLLNDELKDLSPISVNSSFQVNSRNELFQTIENLESSTALYLKMNPYKRIIQPWFFKNDGQASTRIAFSINSIFEGCFNSRQDINFFEIAKEWKMISLKQFSINLLSWIVGSHIIEQFLAIIKPRKKIKQFSVNDIATIVDNLRQLKFHDLNLEVMHGACERRCKLSSIEMRIISNESKH